MIVNFRNPKFFQDSSIKADLKFSIIFDIVWCFNLKKDKKIWYIVYSKHNFLTLLNFNLMHQIRHFISISISHVIPVKTKLF